MRTNASHSLLPQLTTLLLAIALPFLIVTNVSFPFLGIALAFTLVSSACLYFKPKITPWNIFAFSGIIFFSIFLVLRANPLLIFFDIFTNIGLLSILFLPDNYIKSFWHVFLLPLEALAKVFQTDNQFPLDLSVLKKGPDSKTFLNTNTIVSVLITLGVLIVVIPLLSASNPLFKNLVDSVLNFFDLGEFLRNLFSDNAVIWLFRLGFFLFLLFFIPRALSYTRAHHVWENHRTLITQSLSLLLPKLAVLAVFIIFFITQAQLYFASSEMLTTLGYTNSEATREVFGHLLIVCLVVFALIYNDRSQKKWNTWTTYALLFGVALMNLMAFKSDFDYTSLFGFTEKRLYGFSVNLWIFGALGIYLLDFKAQHLDHLVKKLGVWFILVLGLVNILNFDYLIYNFNRARTGEGEDATYLVTLSEDAGSYDKRIRAAVNQAKPIDPTSGSINIESTNAYTALNNVDDLRNAAKRGGFANFNLSRQKAYDEVRDLDVDKLRKTLDTKRQPRGSNPTQVPVSHSVGNLQNITVIFRNLDDRFRNQRFQLVSTNTSTDLRQEGNLNVDSFIHTLGPGNFTLVLSLPNELNSNFAPTRVVNYTIPEDLQGSVFEIDFSKF